MDYEQKIGERLNSVLSDTELYPYCVDAYTTALQGVGLTDAKTHAEKVLGILKSEKPLREREAEVWNYFRTLSVNGIILEEHMASLVADRRRIMLEQISPYLLHEGKTADYGAGNGEFMRLVASKFPKLEIEGWDIVTDDSKKQVQTYDGKHIPRDDGSYAQVYATTVLHHTRDSKAGAREIARLSNNRIILIETIAGDRTGDRTKDWNIAKVGSIEVT